MESAGWVSRVREREKVLKGMQRFGVRKKKMLIHDKWKLLVILEKEVKRPMNYKMASFNTPHVIP